ncbi:MAG: hypothetical protein PHH59_12905 [Methylovulum sp.]|uniref:hypothetical protein n=1 Tax=Methylovulum sp. TaxID=1916980 RepID=UPI00263445A1|nr:hypothetical protein [Methylovulum sp.]MDD2724907.1 hypothetical protein [Methylovulum sp.]MDD5124277.1 hypothetical protein [Methylovulum sp.]
MTESRFNPAKPIAVTAICIIGLINAIQMLNVLLSPVIKQLGTFYLLYFGTAALISLACIIGLWFLRRWAAFVYMVVLLGNQIVLLTMGLWEPTALVVPLVIIGVILRYFKQWRS